ncbi:TPX2 domain-containing protein [Heracleum sosnowskyi]|uniref:TPX2 domain-containing protein n=1 Tax=Heracleum sosnowskyi TaxID=360622 RepID=A0AAD8JK01_9APIA|nr:TPX2 domain-containing protein [Heracleum sosnowskyi]
MESDNGVGVDDQTAVSEKNNVEESVVDFKKEEDGGKVSSEEGSSESVTNVEQVSNVSAGEVQSKKVLTGSAMSKASKAPGGDNNLKNSKVSKDRIEVKGSTVSMSKGKSRLTQSRSFPANGLRKEGMSKSTDGQPLRSNAKNSHTKGSKVEATKFNGKITSVARMNPASRRASTGVNSKEANANGGGASSRRSTLTSLPNQSHKTVEANGAPRCPPSEGFLPVDQPPKPTKAALLSTEDDDSRSTTSSVLTPRGTSRSSASGFSFRLDERAEKRREFYSKIEQKIHAKEVEKSTLQEKSKESQEAEIKRLRKSLKFKATPMPSFYKEPPPKVELKKTPTTRAKSPKFGRNKSVTVNSLEEGGSGPGHREQDRSAKLNQANNNDVSVSKKLLRKSLSSLAVSKTGEKPTKLRQKPTNPEAGDEKDRAVLLEESKKQPSNPSGDKDCSDVGTEQASVQDNGSFMNSSNPEMMPHAELTVGC